MVARRLLNNEGTTLTELMIVIAILGIVFMVVPKLLINMTRFTKINEARLETQRNAREALTQINKLLRQAKASTITISQESGQPPLSSIVFETIDNRDVKYYQEGRDLKFVTSGSTRTVSEGLRYIAFTMPRTDDAKILSVSLTFEKGTFEGGTKALQMAIEKVRVMND